MQTLGSLLKNYFTHKDFLPPADQIAGTLFTPLHLAVALVYGIYLLIHALPYLPSFLANRKKVKL